MKLIAKIVVCLGSLMAINATYAAEGGTIHKTLQGMININLEYAKKFYERVPKDSLVKQTPNSTVVLCSDSRVETNAFNENPAGDVFTIRNIGNQFQTAQGSVEYGVDYLHTPLLLIIGHSGCGAVKAAMEQYKPKSLQLLKEIDTLRSDPTGTLDENVLLNVNYQVDLATKRFQKEVDSGELTIIGMIYDLYNNFNYGYGRLILVNINNDTNPQNIAAQQYVKNLKDVTILGLE